jgi:hypothetical protein
MIIKGCLLCQQNSKLRVGFSLIQLHIHEFAVPGEDALPTDSVLVLDSEYWSCERKDDIYETGSRLVDHDRFNKLSETFEKDRSVLVIGV